MQMIVRLIDTINDTANVYVFLDVANFSVRHISLLGALRYQAQVFFLWRHKCMHIIVAKYSIS